MTTEEAVDKEFPCPNCGGSLAEGQVLCLACGYHTGLGRCVGSGSATGADESVASSQGSRKATMLLQQVSARVGSFLGRARPALSQVVPLLRRAGGRRGLAIGAVAVVVFLLALVLAPRVRRDGEVADKGSQEQAAYAPLAIPEGRDLSSEEREEAYRHLAGVDADTVASELARMTERDGREVANMLAQLPVRDGAIATITQLREHFALVSRILPEGQRVAFDRCILELVGKPDGPLCCANLEPDDVSVLAVCPESLRPRLAVAIMRQATEEGLPVAGFFAWWNALAEAGAGAYGAFGMAPASFSRDAVERIIPSVVFLRAGKLHCLGLVMAVRNGEVFVAVALEGAKTPGSERGIEWEVDVGGEGAEEWVPALRTGPVVGHPAKQPKTFARLVAFPAAGTLEGAVPASVASGEGLTEPFGRLFVPFLPGDAAPRPGQWRIALSQRSMKTPKMVGCILLGPSGEMVGIGSLGPGGRMGTPFAGLSVPRLVRRDLVADPEGRAAIRIAYDLLDPDEQVVGATAAVGSGAGSMERNKAKSNYSNAPETSAFESAAGLPLTRQGGAMLLTLKPPFPCDGTALLVQPSLHLQNGEVMRLAPEAIHFSGNRPQAVGDWLADGETRRFLEAQARGTAMALDHTVDGLHLRYGCLDLVELAMEPNAVVLDATGDHFYVADSTGVRRIRAGGFRETSGLPVREGKAVALAGSAQGLVAVVEGKEGASVKVLDRETLAEQFSLSGASVPEFLVGSWRSPLIVSVGGTSLSVVDLAARRLVQRLDTAELNRLLFGDRPAPRRLVMGIEFSRDGQLLYLLSEAAIHCLNVTADGLAKAGDDGILCKLAIPQREPTPLIVGPDGDYAIAGMVVYDLRTRPAQAGPLLFSRPMFLHVPTGRMLGESTVNRTRGLSQLLDHRGVEILAWPARQNATTRRAAIHPDGNQCLLWSGAEALWVTIGTEEATAW